MRFKYPTYCFFIIALLSATSLVAQYKFDQSVIIDKGKGLPANSVRAMAKGPDGFIWIGTLEGLCRFDGREVKIFRPSEDKQHTFWDNNIYAVLPLKNEIWAGTNQGLVVLNTVTESFRYYQFGEKTKEKKLEQRFNQDVSVVYLDKQKKIWIGTKNKGLWLYNREKDSLSKIEYPEESYQTLLPAVATNNTILSFEESGSNDSILWVGTTAGLQKINKFNKKVEWYTFANEDKYLQVSRNAFRRLYHHDDGKLYVGSWTAGVNVFDPATKSFVPLTLKTTLGKELLTSAISEIERKSKHEIWITTGAGLMVYNTKEKVISWSKKNDILNNEFYGISFIDELNRAWYFNNNGVHYFDPLVQQFVNYSYDNLFNKGYSFAFYMISDQSGNNITVCPRVGYGLYHFNKISQTWTKSPFNDIKNIASTKFIVRGFVETEPGKYMISTDIGLYYYSMSTKKLIPVPNQPKLEFNRWGDLIKDQTGNIWICALDEGLIKWNIQKNKYKTYKEELIPDIAEPGLVRLSNLYEDSKHNVWVARNDGFSVHLYKQDSIVNFIYSKSLDNIFPIINAFKEDKNGKIWVAGPDGWYGYIESGNPEKGIVKKYNLRSNNINGYLISLAKDKSGNVWGYTPYELVKIDANDLSLSTYSFSYGVKTPDFYHFSFLPSGELIFGGRNSITLSNPEELKRNAELPEPYIDQLKVFNKVINSSEYQHKELKLGYKKNFLTIYFSAKAYTMPEGVRFRYRLRDFDNWTEVKGGQYANYTNIPPGHYIFQLQAANNEGVWNEKMLELPIYIITPWWQTWWFRFSLLVLIAGIIYAIYQNRVRQIRKKEKLKTQFEKKLASVEMTALLAQMNPHFLFNSLNSIDSYIIKNESGKASEYLNNFARLMRLILQNSRSNYTSLKDEVELLDLYLQMESLRFKDKFQYEINVADNLNTASIVIPPMLIQPYVENAIWHGLMHINNDKPGKVDIKIKENENKLICIIQDNGIGRDKAAAIKAQKPGNHKRSMGMQITKDRIDLINKLYNTNTSVKIIDLKDDAGNPLGTRVELVIPF